MNQNYNRVMSNLDAFGSLGQSQPAAEGGGSLLSGGFATNFQPTGRTL